MNSQQPKLDFYNIQLEYSTEEYDPLQQSATYIEIRIDISNITKNHLFYNLLDMQDVLRKIDIEVLGYTQSTNHEEGILIIVFNRNKDTLCNYIKVVEEILEYIEQTDMKYIGSTITINDTSL